MRRTPAPSKLASIATSTAHNLKYSFGYTSVSSDVNANEGDLLQVAADKLASKPQTPSLDFLIGNATRNPVRFGARGFFVFKRTARYAMGVRIARASIAGQ